MRLIFAALLGVPILSGASFVTYAGDLQTTVRETNGERIPPRNNQRQTIKQACLDDELVTGGGFFRSGVNPHRRLDVASSRPIDAKTWQVDFINETRFTFNVTIYAVCAKKTISGGGVNFPAGTVIISKNATCPTGWSPFKQTRGRFVVGSGDPSDNVDPKYVTDDAGNNLTERTLVEPGGSQSVQLNVAQLPSHRHPMPSTKHSHSIISFGSSGGNVSNPGNTAEAGGHGHDHRKGQRPTTFSDTKISRTDATGSGNPISVLPPYIGLNFCVKD